MQAVQDAVRVHPFAVSADLDRRALARTIDKLRARLPDLERDRKHADRRRRAGEASHVLVAYWPGRTETGFFVLLSSLPEDGSGEERAYRDVRERHTRLAIRGDWYELVRHTAPGASAPRWTWRMSAEREAKLEKQISEAVAKRWDKWLAETGRTSSRWPGFAGVRAAHKRLGDHYEQRWKRVRRADEPMPAWWSLPYTRKRARAPDHAHETGGERVRRTAAQAAAVVERAALGAERLREILAEEVAAHEAARGTKRAAPTARAVAATRRAIRVAERAEAGTLTVDDGTGEA